MRKNIVLTVMSFCILLCISNSVQAATSFSVPRKSLKIYEKYDLSQILETDSDVLTYVSSDTSVGQVSDDGIVTTSKLGEFTITVTDEEGNTDSCTFSSGYYVGIDVSKWNGTVDWAKVKAQGIDFAMIRASYGWYDEVEDAGKSYDFQFDTQLLNNMKGASENEIPFGVYHYSYATTTDEAELEAEYVLSAVTEYGKDYLEYMTLPIAYDVEDSKLTSLSRSELTQVVIAFCTKIYEAGYTPIVYANNNFFANYLDLDTLSALAYNFWYARYKSTTDFSSVITIADTAITPIMWQYTSSASIDGANTSSGTVDMDILYMADRVKVTVLSDGETIDTIGADKDGKADYLPECEKEGYSFLGFVDEAGNTVDVDYIYSSDTAITAKYEKIAIEAIELEESEIEITDEGDYYVKVKSFLPSEALTDGESVELSVSDSSVATVDDTGKITAYSNGECIVTCTLVSDSSVYATCKVTVNLSISKIEVTTLPSKTEYIQNYETLDLTGGILTVTYTDNIKEEIALGEVTVTGFDNTKIGMHTLTVVYGTKSTTFNVYVVQKSIEDVKILTLPTKIEYIQNYEELDLDGGTIEISYNDETQEIVDMSDGTIVTVSGFTNENLGQVEVSLILKDNTTTYTLKIYVTIVKKSIESVTILQMPDKTNYLIGETLDLTGASIKIVYNDETEKVIYLPNDEVSVSQIDLTNYGKKTITLTYEETTTTFVVYVVTENGVRKGDLDRDGDVDAVDAALALDFYKYGGETEEDLEIGDIDEDNDIDATDAALILDVYKYGD